MNEQGQEQTIIANFKENKLALLVLPLLLWSLIAAFMIFPIERTYELHPNMGPLVVVNVNDKGEQANSYSGSPSINADGRFIAFDSSATNLDPKDTNEVWDVFLRDTATKKTTKISYSPKGTHLKIGSVSPIISADGQKITFLARAYYPNEYQSYIYP